MEWKPIESAPRDVAILVYGAGIQCVMICRSRSEFWALDGDDGYEGDYVIKTPTHWMELPSPPKAEGVEDGGEQGCVLRPSGSAKR